MVGCDHGRVQYRVANLRSNLFAQFFFCFARYCVFMKKESLIDVVISLFYVQRCILSTEGASYALVNIIIYIQTIYKCLLNVSRNF